jgi:integrase
MNPVDRIRPVGKRQHGKPHPHQRGALVVEHRQATREQRPPRRRGVDELLMGMRTSEILGCMARDIDDRGRLLWIPVSKTRSSRRVLEIRRCSAGT